MMIIFPINELANPLLMNIYSLLSGCGHEKIACILGDTEDVSDVTQFSVKYEQ
jgi:hypothetical protein